MNYKVSLFIIGFIFFACHKKELNTNEINLKGSKTSLTLINKLCEYYNKNRKVKVYASGNGSEEGIQELLNGEVNFINSSRKISNDEYKIAEKRHQTKFIEVIFAVDAPAIIVNPKIGVYELSIFQIKDILSGKIKNWIELGGQDKKIQIYSRNTQSGTAHFIRNKFGIESFYSPIILSNAKEIVKAIQQDESGIGYVDLSSISQKDHFPIDGVWAINLSIENNESVSPFEKLAVLEGKYPLTRPLYQYYPKNNKQIQEFVEFELSEIGQQIIEQAGFFPLQAIHQQINKERGFKD